MAVSGEIAAAAAKAEATEGAFAGADIGAPYPYARAKSAEGCASSEPWACGAEVERIIQLAIELQG